MVKYWQFFTWFNLIVKYQLCYNIEEHQVIKANYINQTEINNKWTRDRNDVKESKANE